MHPLPEYPRPAMRRDSYENLNGLWQYAITASAQRPAGWDGEILVPYAPECRASGVGRTLQPGQWLHYHRYFAPPAGTGGRVLLHFGAVDYACAVQVNGHLVGGHRGGYWPFTLDVTAQLNDTGRNSLWVAVQDPTGHGTQARGKQTLKPGGMFYPAQSGIWQTVWLERVPENYIQSLTVTPDYDARTVTVKAHTSAPGGAANLWAVVRAGGVTIAEDWGSDEAGQDGEVTLHIADEYFFPWSPDTPFLYDLTVGTTQGEEEQFDTVHSYFALRKWSCAPDAHGVLRFCLNDKPILLNGLLDQGYWPEGLYTPPSDAAVERELSEVKALGYNLLRKHAKIEPQRWYYHCDKLGLVVWQDMVNGGSKYNLWFVTYLTNVLQPLMRRLPDKAALWGLLSRGSESSREEYRRELEDTVQALRCHPCVGCWVPFNEGWGQYDAAGAVQTIRTLDDTRLVDEASGWYDQGGGDVYSLHNYFYPLRVRPQTRTVALSEYGGIAWPMPGHEPPRKTYGYGTAKSREELTARYKKMQLGTVLPQLQKGLSALVYTQLTDVEDEVNGLFTYDRTAIKPDANAVRSVNAALAAEDKPTKPTRFETDKEKLRQIIRKTLNESFTVEDFARKLLQYGVTVKESRGRFSYLTPDRTKPITGRKLGDSFDKAAVLAALEQNALRSENTLTSNDGNPLDRTLSSNEGASDKFAPKQSVPQAPSIGRMVDREAKRAEGKGIGYDRWATMHNLKAWSKTFMYLQEHDLLSPDKLSAAVDAAGAEAREARSRYDAATAKVTDKKAMLEAMDNYRKTYPVIKEYRAIRKEKDKQKFYAAHEADFIINDAAKRQLDKLGARKLLRKRKEVVE